jgi:SnoaL-like domain
MPSIPELMIRLLMGVFNERNKQRRVAEAAEIFAEDVVFVEPDGKFVGRDAIEGKARSLLEAAPGWVYTPVGPARESGGELGLQSWHVGPEGGEPVVHGIDVALIRDGRIQTLHTFVTQG